MADPARQHLARTARRIAIVLVATVLLWLGAQALGGGLGWPPQLVFVFDVAALAAFAWALAVTFRLWRARQGH
jgi:hypothetical protein